jgi:hypothetical protein
MPTDKVKFSDPMKEIGTRMALDFIRELDRMDKPTSPDEVRQWLSNQAAAAALNVEIVLQFWDGATCITDAQRERYKGMLRKHLTNMFDGDPPKRSPLALSLITHARSN